MPGQDSFQSKTQQDHFRAKSEKRFGRVFDSHNYAHHSRNSETNRVAHGWTGSSYMSGMSRSEICECFCVMGQNIEKPLANEQGYVVREIPPDPQNGRKLRKIIFLKFLKRLGSHHLGREVLGCKDKVIARPLETRCESVELPNSQAQPKPCLPDRTATGGIHILRRHRVC